MRVGDLKHSITVLHNTNDGTVEPLPTDWQPFFSFVRNGQVEHDIAAAKKGLTGRLFYQAAAAQSENDVIFTISYYYTGITPTMHITDESGQAYEITSEPVDVADEHRWLEIHARRISQNGS